MKSLPRGLSSVSGELRSSDATRSLAGLRPVVVYLEREPKANRWPSLWARTIYGGVAGSVEDTLVVVAQGDPVRFAGRSGLEHRLFAVHGRERIDVEVPARGRSRRVRLRRQGPTRFYCSLHQDEIWDTFVAPSRLFSSLDPASGYRIARVPPGNYRLGIWSPQIDGIVGQVQVGVWTATSHTIWLDPALVFP